MVAGVRISFLFKAEQYSMLCIDHVLLIHSSSTDTGLLPLLGPCE